MECARGEKENGEREQGGGSCIDVDNRIFSPVFEVMCVEDFSDFSDINSKFYGTSEYSSNA